MRRSALSIAIKHIKPSIKPIVTIKFSKLDVVWLSVVVLNAVAPTFMDFGWGNLQVETNKRIWRQRFQFFFLRLDFPIPGNGVTFFS